jgi:secreted trypsin-like serine protease
MALRHLFLSLTLSIAQVCCIGTAWAIVNGTPVTDAEYAAEFGWTVALVDDSTGAICGAELISPTMLLTAAHCASTNASAFIGRSDWTLARRVGITEAIVHPQYDAQRHRYDLALLRLATPVYTVAPIRVATAAEINAWVVANATVTIAGWGGTADAYGHALQTSDVTLGQLHLIETWIYYVDPQTGPCPGDSGTSMTMLIAGRPELVGLAVLTMGDLCAMGGGAAAYTNLGLVQDFILANVMDLPKRYSKPGDFNGDGIVNIIDLNLLKLRFGTYNTYIDLDGDGFVGLSDVAIFRSLLR